MIPLSIISNLPIISNIKNFITSTLGQIIIISVMFIGVIGYFKFELYIVNNKLDKTKSELNITTLNYNNVLKLNKDNENILKQYQIDLNKTTNSYKIIIQGKNNEVNRLKEIIASYSKPIIYPNNIKKDKCEFNISEVIKDEKILIGF